MGGDTASHRCQLTKRRSDGEVEFTHGEARSNADVEPSGLPNDRWVFLASGRGIALPFYFRTKENTAKFMIRNGLHHPVQRF